MLCVHLKNILQCHFNHVSKKWSSLLLSFFSLSTTKMASLFFRGGRGRFEMGLMVQVTAWAVVVVV